MRVLYLSSPGNITVTATPFSPKNSEISSANWPLQKRTKTQLVQHSLPIQHFLKQFFTFFAPFFVLHRQRLQSARKLLLYQQLNSLFLWLNFIEIRKKSFEKLLSLCELFQFDYLFFQIRWTGLLRRQWRTRLLPVVPDHLYIRNYLGR